MPIVFTILTVFVAQLFFAGYTATSDPHVRQIIHVHSDSIPDFYFDTIEIFDPNTLGHRTVIYKVPSLLITYNSGRPLNVQLTEALRNYYLDTVTVFDPETFKEICVKITAIPVDE